MPSTTIAGMAHYEMLVSHSPPVFSHSPPVAFLSDYGPNVNRLVEQLIPGWFISPTSNLKVRWIWFEFGLFSLSLSIESRYFDPSRSLCRTQSLTPIQSRQKFHQQLANKMPTAPKRPCLVVKPQQQLEQQQLQQQQQLQIHSSDSTDSKITSSIDKKWVSAVCDGMWQVHA